MVIQNSIATAPPDRRNLDAQVHDEAESRSQRSCSICFKYKGCLYWRHKGQIVLMLRGRAIEGGDSLVATRQGQKKKPPSTKNLSADVHTPFLPMIFITKQTDEQKANLRSQQSRDTDLGWASRLPDPSTMVLSLVFIFRSLEHNGGSPVAVVYNATCRLRQVSVIHYSHLGLVTQLAAAALVLRKSPS